VTVSNVTHPDSTKCPRQAGFSKVSYPGRTAAIFKFHLRIVKPAIRSAIGSGQTEVELRAMWSEARGEEADNPLLIDTRTGEGYMTGQIRSTLARFLNDIDPEMPDITPSAVRSSFASWKYNAFKQGRIFSNKTEQEFLDILAKIMNTSVEQLESTYIAAREMDTIYDRSINVLHGEFDGHEPDNEFDHEEDGMLLALQE
jgi:hypothetical protein